MKNQFTRAEFETLVDDSFCSLAELAQLYQDTSEHWKFTRAQWAFAGHHGQYWVWVRKQVNKAIGE